MIWVKDIYIFINFKKEILLYEKKDYFIVSVSIEAQRVIMPEFKKYSEEISNRRVFLKKAVYHTPVLYVLGTLMKPVSAYADHTGGPDGPPGGFLSTSSSSKKSSKKTTKRKKLRF